MPREVYVLKSGRCSWGECLFCGYGRIYGDNVKADSLNEEFMSFFSKIPPETDEVCIYGSGSFLDENQVPAKARLYFIDECRRHGIRKLTVESRPEHVKKNSLSDFEGLDYTIAIGVEVADEKILDKLNKGFTLKEFETAAKTIHEMHGKVRAYLLVNPPYVKDMRKSLDKSVEYTLKHADSIVLINTLPHSNAPLFELWVTGEWNFLGKKEFEEVTKKWTDNPKIELDAETFRFTPKFPKRLRTQIKGVGEEYLTHPYFEVWQDWLTRWYTPPKNKRTLIFLPCSFRKPYSESETHKKIIKALEETGKRNTIHEVMLSNAGVIPREFEDDYPFNAYDWDEKLETPEIKERYIEVTTGRIVNYLTSHKRCYDVILCYLKYDSESYQALLKASKESDLEVKNLLKEDTYKKIKESEKPLTREDALKDLEYKIKNEVR